MNPNVEIICEHVDSYKGQNNYIMKAQINNQPAGDLAFSEYEGKIQVSHIAVLENKRRQGVATELLISLQEKYPDTVIDLGMTTNDGSLLVNSLNFEVYPNTEYEKAKAELSNITRTLDEYCKLVVNITSDQQREEIVERTEDWNILEDKAETLRVYLNQNPSEFRYIKRNPEQPAPLISLS